MHSIAIAAGLLLGASAHAAEVAYPCYRVPSAPAIDGNVLGDPAWQRIPFVTGFRVLGDGYAEAKQTTARACWDGEALYVGLVCEEPDTAQLKPTAKDGGWTWAEDSAEIFLQPKLQGDVYQFGVTAGGAKGSGENHPDIARCTAAAKIGQGEYSLEIRIPFGVVGARVGAGDRWRVTFCRNIYTTNSGGDQYTNWAPLLTRFLEPEHFLPMAFLGDAPDATAAAQETEALNAAYRAVLVEDLRSAAGRGKDYTGALEEAGKDARFAQEAGALLGQWRTIDQVNREAGGASLTDMRQAIRTARSLVEASYRVKYEYLLTKLING